MILVPIYILESDIESRTIGMHSAVPEREPLQIKSHSSINPDFRQQRGAGHPPQRAGAGACAQGGARADVQSVRGLIAPDPSKIPFDSALVDLADLRS